jgi:DNA-binding transcriptional MerR regulator
MQTEIKEQLAAAVRQFRLPRYEQLPDMGLYLDQTVHLINEYLSPLQENTLTSSMVSNYVKKGLVESPLRKRYSREQIAYLIFITLAKSVLSLEDLKRFIRVQQRSYTARRAYDYLCEELENILAYVFGLKDTVDNVGVDSTVEKMMLRTTIIAAAHKIYLDKYFALLPEEDTPETL